MLRFDMEIPPSYKRSGQYCRYFGLLSLCGLMAAFSSLNAAEKGGLLVDISKSVVSRHDGPRDGDMMELNRTMSLKLDVKNTSSKDMPATTVDYIALIQRWGSETGSVERYSGTKPLEKLNFAHDTKLLLGDFHIGGHMHGSSDRHADRLVAWKVIITRDGEKLEFVSGSTFESLNKRARQGS